MRAMDYTSERTRLDFPRRIFFLLAFACAAACAAPGEPAVARTEGEAAQADQTGRKSPRFALVKFFTRHGIVALAAYGMMVRLHVDPLGVLLGVTSLGIAVGVEALRDLRWRRFL